MIDAGVKKPTTSGGAGRKPTAPKKPSAQKASRSKDGVEEQEAHASRGYLASIQVFFVYRSNDVLVLEQKDKSGLWKSAERLVIDE